MINDGFTLEMIEYGFSKNAGLVDMAKSVGSSLGGFVKDTGINAAETAHSMLTSPLKNMKDNWSMMWDPKISDDADVVSKTLNNKWVSRALNLGFPAMDIYNMYKNPELRTDPEMIAGLVGSQVGNYMIPLSASAPVAIATSMGMMSAARAAGRKVKEWMKPKEEEKKEESDPREQDRQYIQAKMQDDPAFRAQIRNIALDVLDEAPTVSRRYYGLPHV